MALAHSPRIVTDGLVLALDASNPRSYPGSGTTWSDLIGSNNGTLTNGPTFSSADGGSIVFDGTNDYSSISGSSDLTFGAGDFTVEMWVYATNFTNRGTFFDSRKSDSVTGMVIGHESSTGEIRVYMPNLSVTTTDFSAGLWNHIAVTCESTTVRLFVNGSLKATGTGANLSDTLSPVNIGYRTYTSSSYTYFNGKISNVKIYKAKGLTASEVQQNYNALKGRFGI